MTFVKELADRVVDFWASSNIYPMKRLCILLLCLPALPAHSQVLGPHLSYLNRKTISIGYTENGINTGVLNGLLTTAGYTAVPASVGTVTLHAGSDFGTRFGVFSDADIGLTNKRKFGDKRTCFQYNRFYVGGEYTMLRKGHLELLGRLAISYMTATLRLYDTLADTSSFTNYLNGTADAKRFQTEIAGIDAGIQMRLRAPHNNSFIGVRAGYILAIGANTWNHDAGHFGGAPRTPIGS